MNTTDNYKVEEFFDNNFYIYEKPTERYIMTFDHAMRAHAMCRKLNANSGFEGETPSFMTNHKILHIKR